jgi:hypothetical protein
VEVEFHGMDGIVEHVRRFVCITPGSASNRERDQGVELEEMGQAARC